MAGLVPPDATPEERAGHRATYLASLGWAAERAAALRRDLPTGRVGHLQIAGVPDRHEPDRGELDVHHLFRVVDDLGFDGWIGCEHIPLAGTSEGLGRLDGYGPNDYRGDTA